MKYKISVLFVLLLLLPVAHAAVTRITQNMSYVGSVATFGNWTSPRLTDGNFSNGGQSISSAPLYWYIDFGQGFLATSNTTDLATAVGSGGGSVATSWSVDVSSDNNTWIPVLTNHYFGGAGLHNATFGTVSGRYWRFTLVTNDITGICPNGCWIDDFGLWGSISNNTNLTIIANNSINLSGINNFCVNIYNNGASNTSQCTVTSSPASPLLANTTIGLNSQTLQQNLNDFLYRGVTLYNTTQIVNNGTANLLWVPWYSSSTACDVSVLKTYGSLTVASMINNTMVTDEFSEVGISLAMGNATIEPYFEMWYNTYNALPKNARGLLPWVWSRRNATFTDETGSTSDASDATQRIIIALYDASVNPSFTANNRTKYRNTANTLASISLKYDNVLQCVNTSRYGSVCVIPFAGDVAASQGLDRSDVDFYQGYIQDTLKSYLMAYGQTSNTTYLAAVQNITAAYLSGIQYTGVGVNFTAYQGTWNQSLNDLQLFNGGGGVNSYYWNTSNPQWDTEDAVRANKLCEIPRLFNITTGSITGVMNNLSTLCIAWANSGTSNSFIYNSTAQQYQFNGSGFATNDGFFYNAMRALGTSYTNVSLFKGQLDYTLTKYDPANLIVFGTSCGDGLTYETSHTTQLLGIALGKELAVINGTNLCIASPNVETQNGITITITNPINASNQVNSPVIISVNIVSNNGTVTSTAGTLPQLLYNSSLCTIDPGFTQATYSAGTCSENWTSGNMYSNNLSMESRYPTAEFTLLVNFTYPGGTNNKFRPTNVGPGSLGSGTNKFNLEAQNSTHFHIKADRGTFSSTGNYYYNRSITANFTTNFTNNVSRACIGSDCTSWEAFTRDTDLEDYFAIEAGNPSGLPLQIFNYTIQQNTQAYNLTSVDATSNVSIYDTTNGNLLLTTQNNVSNNTAVTYSWIPNNGVNNWRVDVRSGGGTANFTNTFNFANFYNANFCTSNGIISQSLQAGTYNITAYNVSGDTYINQTTTILFTTAATQQLLLYQGLFNISVQQLFTNNNITKYNVTNYYQFNVSTSQYIIVGANNGSNNIKIDVPGNYSKNVTCTGVSQATTYCNVTGIYDNLFTIGATDGSSPLSSWNVTAYNASLGGYLYNVNVGSNQSTQLPLLQGYYYTFDITKSGRVENITTKQATSSTGLYNGTLGTITFGVNFLEEINRTSLAGLNISFTVIDSTGAQTAYSTNTSSLTLAGTLPPGSYTFRYTANGYSSRDYYFTMGYQNQNITLYLLSSTIYTPGTVEVRNPDNSLVSGAIVTISRAYPDPSLPNIAQMATTNSYGQALMTAQAVNGYYLFNVTVNGVTLYASSVPELLPIQNDGLWHKTFILPKSGSNLADQYSGFFVQFPQPTGILYGNNTYTFTTNITSTIWNITQCTFQIINSSNGALLGSQYGFCNNNSGIASITYTTDNQSYQIQAVVGITTAYFSNTYGTAYSILPYVNESFTMRNAIDDISRFRGSGFNNFSRIFMSFLFMIGIIFSLSRTTNLINSGEELVVLLFLLSLFFSYVGWLDIGLNNVTAGGINFPIAGLGQYFITILIGLLAGGVIIDKMRANQ